MYIFSNYQETNENSQILKNKIRDQTLVLKIDNLYTKKDYNNALNKLQIASGLYDKNKPLNYVQSTVFDVYFLTPMEFKYALKKTFKLTFSIREISSIINDYIDENGNIDCNMFKSSFQRMGK
jgi:hypothetical protein